MDKEAGRRSSSINRSAPITKTFVSGSRSQGYSFGTDYNRNYEERLTEKIVEEDNEIYQVPEANHITNIPLRTPPPPPIETRSEKKESVSKKDNGADLFISTSSSTAPFSHRNNSMRSPRHGQKLDKSSTTPSMDTLRRESDIVRLASRTPSGGNISVRSESGWAGTKLAGKVDSAKTPSIRSYWEQNIHKERLEKEELARNVRPKSYGFPKWRSSDALSASLVASNSVDIPRDSRIPEDRLKKMEQTDREAVIIKHHIHQAIEPTRPLHKGKSLDSLVVQEQQQQMPNSWYDREKIRDGVNRESIANIHESRYRFENGEFNPPHHQHQRDRSYSGAGRYEVSSHPHSTVPVAPPAPPLPPKSEDILVRQNRYSECQDSVDSYVNVNPRQVSNSQSMHTINSSNTHIHNNNDNNNINYNNNNNCTYQNAYSKECQLTLEQQLLLLYVKQNPEVVSSVGVTYPEYTRLMMDDVPYRRVELRSSEDDPQNIQYSPNNQKGNGRYIKKPQVANVVQRFRKNEPVRERQDDIRPGESFVAAEIRQAREREEELKRSRSELGLPTLEDTIDSWRNGQKGFLSSQLRTAVSYDHLHQNGVQKAPSMGELSHESYGSYSRNEQGSRTDLRNPRPGYGPTPYRLQNTDDQDVMFYGPTRRQIPQLKRFD